MTLGEPDQLSHILVKANQSDRESTDCNCSSGTITDEQPSDEAGSADCHERNALTLI
jgi:hypothetical protein